MPVRLCIACTLFLSVASVGTGDDDARSYVLKRQPEELVVGDWYQINSQNGPTHLSFKGVLYKANEKWIVLGTGHLPHNVVFCTWIPRDAATVIARRKTDIPVHAIESEFPRTAKTDADVRMLRGGERYRRQVNVRARVVGVKESTLVLADEKIPLSEVLCVKIREPFREAQQLSGQPAGKSGTQAAEETD